MIEYSEYLQQILPQFCHLKVEPTAKLWKRGKRIKEARKKEKKRKEKQAKELDCFKSFHKLLGGGERETRAA